MVRSLLRPFTSDIFEPLDFGGWEWPEDVFAEMDRISREMSRRMNRMFRRFGLTERPRLSAATYPALDLWEDENCLYVEAELPANVKPIPNVLGLLGGIALWRDA